tara:strand:+ start:4347 stop:4538 length:192 start_codon:yes stop_codon:yes gene_type:complete
MTRGFTCAVTVVGLLILIGIDIRMTPPNPYKSPPLAALGSGISASGGFCGSLINEILTSVPIQ